MIPEFQVQTNYPEVAAEKFNLLQSAIPNKLDILDTELQRRIVTNLQGPILRQLTGKAAASVEMIPAEIQGDVISGSVRAGGGVAPYLRPQEDGTQGPYEITPTSSKALMFLLEGKTIFAKNVIHPGLPARRPVGQTFDDFQPIIQEQLEAIPNEIGGLR